MHEPLPKKWFEVWYIDDGGALQFATLVSETHESAKLAALQRIPMKKFYRTVDKGPVK